MLAGCFSPPPDSTTRPTLPGLRMHKTVEVGGKLWPCKAPSLILTADGSYRMLSESGTYEIVAGRWFGHVGIQEHGRAGWMAVRQIIFEFVSGGKKPARLPVLINLKKRASTNGPQVGCERRTSVARPDLSKSDS